MLSSQITGPSLTKARMTQATVVWKQALEFDLGRRAATVKPELFGALLRSHQTAKGKLPAQFGEGHCLQ